MLGCIHVVGDLWYLCSIQRHCSNRLIMARYHIDKKRVSEKVVAWQICMNILNCYFCEMRLQPEFFAHGFTLCVDITVVCVMHYISNHCIIIITCCSCMSNDESVTWMAIGFCCECSQPPPFACCIVETLAFGVMCIANVLRLNWRYDLTEYQCHTICRNGI